MEAFCPELREPTLLMRIGQLCQGRAATGACASMVYIVDCLWVFRVTGDCSKEDGYTVSRVTGQEKDTPAKVQELSKKQDVIEFIAHEAQLINEGALSCVSMFRTPQALMKRFAASGEGGLVEFFSGRLSPSFAWDGRRVCSTRG
jgi:hypothetical protein